MSRYVLYRTGKDRRDVYYWRGRKYVVKTRHDGYCIALKSVFANNSK